MPRPGRRSPAYKLGLCLVLLAMPRAAAWAGSQASHLIVTNLANSDVVNTIVTQTDNFDWANSRRPDQNFQGKAIPLGTATSQQEDMNSNARSSWFTMQLVFRNGESLTFRNDQKDSLSNKPIYRTFSVRSSIPNGRYVLVQSAGRGNNNFVVMLNVPMPTWMSSVPDSAPLSTLTIPGTHDTATWNTSNINAKTQDRNFGQQLEDGIRFFDIRVRPAKSADGSPRWLLFHGDKYLNLGFDKVLNAVQRFMAGHPGEALIMSIKKDKEAEKGATATMSETFKWYVEKYPGVAWYLGTAYPKLGDMRGKVALLRRFGLDKDKDGKKEAPYGFNAAPASWEDNASFVISNPPLIISVQDVWKAGGQDKINAVDRQIKRARNDPSAQDLSINFTSDSTGSCSWIPRSCASDVMPTVRTLPIDRPSKVRLGCIPMDFYDSYDPFVQVLVALNPFR